jgi:phosphatidylethanolamine/phosphatidyl-N-methylethanolamine N-methyltransferase
VTTTLKTSLADNLRFLRALISRPKNIGAVLPSSPALARAIAAQVHPHTGPVLEIGAGTGVVSEALLVRGVPAEKLVLLEYDPDLCRHLEKRFPHLHVICGDAFDLHHTLGPRYGAPFAAIVSGLPLLNHPPARRRAFMEGIAARLLPGAPFIQFSYGPMPPVPPLPGQSVSRAAMVLANIPPAKVWVYRKA